MWELGSYVVWPYIDSWPGQGQKGTYSSHQDGPRYPTEIIGNDLWALYRWSDASANRLSPFTPAGSAASLHRIVCSTLGVHTVSSDRGSHLVLAELKVAMQSFIYFWHLNIYSSFLRIMSKTGKALILGHRTSLSVSEIRERTFST